MRLRGIDFGPMLDGSGVRGFFGEGYFYHKFLRPFGLDFTGSVFVAKTTTLNPRKGNMPLKNDGITPRELKPKCLKVYFFKKMILNAVGLSGPGAKFLFETGQWQKRENPFFLSFMSVAPSAQARLLELKSFVNIFKKHLPKFRAPVGLQINYSCPNVGLDPQELVREVKEGLKTASVLKIPLMPKFNVEIPIETAEEISRNPECDALSVSNTVPWGKLPEKIDWQKLFGKTESPLAHLGGGGLSGEPLLKLVHKWLKKARQAGISKPINVGGGILCSYDVHTLFNAGASSIFIASAAILRPWRVQEIIKTAYELHRERILLHGFPKEIKIL